jgi:hypothetical protein
MVASINLNPVVTTNAPSTFSTTTNGFIQGTAQDDPATRFQLSGGVLATTETLPMWGGVGISEAIANPAFSATAVADALGSVITRATNTLTGTSATTGSLVGFSVFDQDWAMFNLPQSPVPLAASGMEVNYYRIGSNQRICVACDAALAATLVAGGIPTSTAVGWDFTSQQLEKANTSGWAQATITNAVWASTSGGQVTFTTSAAVTGLAAGDVIDVSGVVNTGGTGPGVFNGSFEVVSTVTTTTVVTYVASASPGTYASGGIIAAEAANVLPIRGVLQINQGGSMTVNYNTATGFATWNYSGTAAIILL